MATSLLSLSAIEVVQLIRQGGVGDRGGGDGRLVICDGLDALPHASGVRVVLEVILNP